MKVGFFVDEFVNQFYPFIGVEISNFLLANNAVMIYPQNQLDLGLNDYVNNNIDLAREKAVEILKTFKETEVVFSLSPRIIQIANSLFPLLFKNTRWIEQYQDFLSKFIEVDCFLAEFGLPQFELKNENSTALVLSYFGNQPSESNYWCHKIFDLNGYSLPYFYLESTGIIPHHSTKPILEEVVNNWLELYSNFVFNDIEAFFHFEAYCIKQKIECKNQFFTQSIGLSKTI